MIAEIAIPQVSANVTEATVITWIKQEGDPVEAGDVLAELSTEKDNVEIESPVSGTLRRVLASEKSTLPVGFILALVGPHDAPLPDVETRNRQVLAQSRELQERQVRGNRKRRAKRSRVRATPAARRLARELGVDLERLKAETDVEVLTEAIVRDFKDRQAP